MTRPYSNVERANSPGRPFAGNAGHKSLRDPDARAPRAASASFMDWIRDLWERLGSPMSREGFSLMPVTVDRFKWRRALKGSGRR